MIRANCSDGSDGERAVVILMSREPIIAISRKRDQEVVAACSVLQERVRSAP